MPRPGFMDLPAHTDALVAGALGAAEPAAAVDLAWQDLPRAGFGLVAIGKAAGPMLAGLARAGAAPAFGLAVGPAGWDRSAAESLGLERLDSDHPLPTDRSVLAGRAALAIAARCSREGLPLVVLLSGGASSLVAVPEAGLEVADIARACKALMHAGAPIEELNRVRRHTDAIKGGRLALAASPSPVYSLIISDVIGDAVETIGSGPTAPDPTTYAEALAVIHRRGVAGRVGPVESHVRAAIATRLPETLKPGEPALARVVNRVILNNAVSVRGAAAAAEQLGFTIAEARTGITGEAREAAFGFVGALRRARAAARAPLAVIWGGETTVTVRGRGRGGRNLEAALAAAVMIEGERDLAVLTLATDGRDGDSSPAGAVITGRTAPAARQAGVDPSLALDDNNSAGFFERVEPTFAARLIRTGATGTNVNDVWVGLVY